MENNPVRNVIIIGGGPSGLSTALHLAKNFPQLTPRLLILEKARYPRPKLCATRRGAEVIISGSDWMAKCARGCGRIHFDFEAKGEHCVRGARHPAR
jgi:flavin-dependent dehydrogenase